MVDKHPTQEEPPRNLARSAFALLTGLVAVIALSLATDHALQLAKVYPGWGQPIFSTRLNLLALSYRCVYSILGSFLAATLSPRHPMRHAMILGGIGFLLSLLGALVAIQNHFGPAWYPLALAGTALPCAWLGGILGLSRRP